MLRLKMTTLFTLLSTVVLLTAPLNHVFAQSQGQGENLDTHAQNVFVLVIKIFQEITADKPEKLNRAFRLFQDNPLQSYFFTLFIFGSYVLFCWPLMMISNKFGDAQWRAWVPVVNVFLLVKLADLPLWIALLVFVPLFAPFALVYICMELCLILRLSRWWGVFIVVPGLNVLLFWFLALNSKAQFFGNDNDRRVSDAIFQGNDRRSRDRS